MPDDFLESLPLPAWWARPTEEPDANAAALEVLLCVLWQAGYECEVLALHCGWH